MTSIYHNINFIVDYTETAVRALVYSWRSIETLSLTCISALSKQQVCLTRHNATTAEHSPTLSLLVHRGFVSICHMICGMAEKLKKRGQTTAAVHPMCRCQICGRKHHNDIAVWKNWDHWCQSWLMMSWLMPVITDDSHDWCQSSLMTVITDASHHWRQSSLTPVMTDASQSWLASVITDDSHDWCQSSPVPVITDDSHDWCQLWLITGLITVMTGASHHWCQ